MHLFVKKDKGFIVKWLRHNVFIITYVGSIPTEAIEVYSDDKANYEIKD